MSHKPRSPLLFVLSILFTLILMTVISGAIIKHTDFPWLLVFLVIFGLVYSAYNLGREATYWCSQGELERGKNDDSRKAG